ncbi:helix-turn-helix transcriptional regulator [Paenibacillus sp. FSL R7-0345]|uniref:helix-turn-helix domain-containing protein n=1 Tax=Paenibacillus sp. FSL R7-0345 TaxID=2954535 RepID=UPI00315B3D08
MYNRIRNLREDKDLTQQQMAELLHITQATYFRYENGNLDVPSAVLITLANFHKESIEFFFLRSNIHTL